MAQAKTKTMRIGIIEIASVAILLTSVADQSLAASDCEDITSCIKDFTEITYYPTFDFNKIEDINSFLQILCQNSDALEKCYTAENIQTCSVLSNLPNAEDAQGRISKQINLICSNRDDYIDFIKCMKKPDTIELLTPCISALSTRTNSPSSQNKEKACTFMKAMHDCFKVALQNGDCQVGALSAYKTIGNENIREMCPTSSSVKICSNVLLFFIILKVRFLLV